MATVWLTYAWDDNVNQDVEFVAEELTATGLTIRLDKWDLGAGRRLWDQIADAITNPEKSDGWLMYATQNSLRSEACQEEYAYALDRAIHSRGSSFPVLALFPSRVDPSLIPAGIRSRLHVALTDPDWKERIVAAAEGRAVQVPRQSIEPYELRVHKTTSATKPYAIEMRPRAGTWSPFICGVRMSEKETVQPSILHGPRALVPGGGILWNSGEGTSDDGYWWFAQAGNEATPTQSYFLICAELPSEIVFGVANSQLQYVVKLGAQKPS